MNKLFIKINPFDAFQPLEIVNEDGKIIATRMSNMGHLTSDSYAMCKSYNANQIVIVGNHVFTNKYKEKIEAYCKKFSMTPIEVITVEK